MRNILLGAASAMALAPSVASAALVLSAPEITISEVPTTSQTVNVDIFFSDVTPPNDTANERLAGFVVRVDIGGNPAGNNTVHLPTARPNRVAVTPADAAKPYIFALAGENPDTGEPAIQRPEFPDNPEAFGPTTITLAGLAQSGREPDIVLNASVVRIPVVIEAGATGLFSMNFDSLVTSFADADGNPIPVTLDNGFINIVPEPASIGLLAIGGLCALRRRRMA